MMDLNLHLATEIIEFLPKNPHYRNNASIDVHAAVLELSTTPSAQTFATLAAYGTSSPVIYD